MKQLSAPESHVRPPRTQLKSASGTPDSIINTARLRLLLAAVLIFVTTLSGCSSASSGSVCVYAAQAGSGAAYEGSAPENQALSMEGSAPENQASSTEGSAPENQAPSPESSAPENQASSTESSKSEKQASSTEGSARENQASSTEGSAPKKITLMLYLCASDLESKAGAATDDLAEIASSGVNTEEVNVVVMAGGTTRWQSSFSSQETAVYVLTAGSGSAADSSESFAAPTGNSTAVSAEAGSAADPEKDSAASPENPMSAASGRESGSGPSGGTHWEKAAAFQAPEQAEAPANMGKKETLQQFLEFSYAHYPAEDYALVLWDHGGGPMRGLCWDTAWAKDNLSMEEFTGALQDSPFANEKLRWIGFDACLMSSIETAHLVAPYAEYMIASEETEPSIGWSYDFLKDMENDADGAATGKRIVDCYMAAGEAAQKDSALTLACMDLAKTKAVEEAMNQFFARLGDSLDERSFSDLSNLREGTREFGKALEDSQRYDLVDLEDLVTHYAGHAPEEAAAFTKALQQMVLYDKSTLENCCGLSAYHPYYNKKYYEKIWKEEYDAFSFAPSYTDYISRFARIWLGESLGDWTQMNQILSAGETEETQYFSIQLTPQQRQYYASSRLLVLKMTSSDDPTGMTPGYTQVFTTDQVTVDENGVLTAGYNGRTLYAVDENDEVVAGPLNYTLSDDGNLQIRADYLNLESGTQRLSTQVMYTCSDAPAGTNLPVLEKYVYDYDMDTWSNRLEIRESDYQYVEFLHDIKKPVYDDGTIRAFSEWEEVSAIDGYEFPLTEEFHFRFYDRILDESALYACFEISDTQTNLYGTELMEVKNPNLTTILFREGGTGGGDLCTFENDDLRMTVLGQLDNSTESASLNLGFVFENLSGKTLNGYLADGFRFSDSSRACTCFYTRGYVGFDQLAPGENKIIGVSFDSISLAGLSDLEEISFTISYEQDPSSVSSTVNIGNSGAGSGNAENTGNAEGDSGNADNTGNAEGDSGNAENTENSEDGSGNADNTGNSGAGSGNADNTGNAGSGENPNGTLHAVLHPVDVDISVISGAEEYARDPAGLAQYTEGELRYTLRSLSVKRSGDIRTVLQCRNEGSDPALMQYPREIAVNGVLLEAGPWPPLQYNRAYYSTEGLMIDPGEECLLVLDAKNSQYGIHYFNHMSGTYHLSVSDLLGTEGVENINTLDFYPRSGIIAVSDQVRQEWEKPPVHFALDHPVSRIRNGSDRSTDKNIQNDGQEKSPGDSSTGAASAGRASAGNAPAGNTISQETAQEEQADGLQEDIEEEMTRALDADGASPTRTKLYEKDGLTVYGEQILIADSSILLSLVLDNESDENRVVRFRDWSFNDGETDRHSIFANYYGTCGYVTYASTRRRIILTAIFPEFTGTTPVHTVSLGILQDGKRSSVGLNPGKADTEEKPGLLNSIRSAQDTQNKLNTQDAQDTLNTQDAQDMLDTQDAQDMLDTQDALNTQDETAGSQESPTAYHVTFTLPEGTTFQMEGGFSLPVEETSPSFYTP